MEGGLFGVGTRNRRTSGEKRKKRGTMEVSMRCEGQEFKKNCPKGGKVKRIGPKHPARLKFSGPY